MPVREGDWGVGVEQRREEGVLCDEDRADEYVLEEGEAATTAESGMRKREGFALFGRGRDRVGV